MSTSIDLQPAMVLHTRPFRDTSMLVDLISPELGRFRAVVRGARRAGSRYRALLQLFQPILVSLRGRGELLTLIDAESAGGPLVLRGERLFSGLYLNEILIRLLPMHQACPVLFARYHETLRLLQGNDPMEPVLRYFEIDLLDECGYAPDFRQDVPGGQPISPRRLYLFHPDHGFEPVPEGSEAAHVYSGRLLIALRERSIASDTTLVSGAKRLLRQALAPHLGNRPLQSREYFGRLSPTGPGR